MTELEKPQAKTGAPFKEYRLRPELLGELHARPFEKMDVPRRVFLMAFLTNAESAKADRAEIEKICISHAISPPLPTANYHIMNLGKWTVRWEQHNEFTTYRWDVEDDAFDEKGNDLGERLLDELNFSAPGDLIVATEIKITKNSFALEDYQKMFDPASLCVIEADRGRARIASDFQADLKGFTHFVVEDHGLGPYRVGALVQRLLEVETYRLLALMGLPVAKKAMPVVNAAQVGLADLTMAISNAKTMEDNHALLKKLTDLAAALEAQAATTSYRFAASQAYYDIVLARLATMHENPVDGARRFSSFFKRRLTPAVATCKTVEERQNGLSRKLMRTAELLRTRIQFELEQQNRDLLKSMNQRAKLQLRLQQTVEGLSVAAVSYYIVGLVKYAADGLYKYDLTLGLSPTILTALSVPLVIGMIWYITRRIHKKFTEDEE